MAEIVDFINGIIWSQPLVYLCLGAGVFFTIRTRLVQVRQIPQIFSQMFRGRSSDKGVASFQALAMSLAGRVGTGNIAGVATAIAAGGPGAVFWMWLVAFLGASTSFVESTLGQIYKEHDRKTGEYRGGPAYYLEKAYQHTRARGFFKIYAIIFAVSTVLAMSFLLPGVQANGIASAVNNAWGVDTWISGVAILIVLAFIIIGGVKRIANFASFVVPFMAVLYIIAAIVVCFVNWEAIPGVIALIFESAFGGHAVFGAILGSAVEWGVKRGIYSNEAGQGTGPHAAAAAEVSHPAKQGLVQAGSVYIDTLFVCTATAFMILSTGMYRVFDPADETTVLFEGGGNLATDVEAGPAFAQAAFDSLAPGLGASFIAISMVFFAFTTIVAYYYMAETNMAYLMRNMKTDTGHRIATIIIQLLALISAIVGATSTAKTIWAAADIGVGIMAWVNIIGILMIQQPALKVLKDFEQQRKLGLDPVFVPSKLGIMNANLWEKKTEQHAEQKMLQD